MSRRRKVDERTDLLEKKLSELTSLIKDLSPLSSVEISYAQYEDEDAHVHVAPPPNLSSEEIENLELALGERCNDILVETGLFIIGAVYD
jgi:hypothetical protein